MVLFDTIKNFFWKNNIRISSGFSGFGNANAEWLSLQSNELYNEIPELRAIIDQQTNMFLKADFFATDKNGKQTNDAFTELLKKPNPFQDKIEFLSTFYKIFNLNDSVWLYADYVGYINKYSKIYVLSDADITFKYKQNTIVEKWHNIIEYAEISLPFTNEKLILQNEELEKLYFLNNSGVSINDIFLGSKKIRAAIKPLSNLRAVYESENVLLSKRGAIGIFSPENPKDQYGELDPRDIETVQKELDKYGMLENMKRFFVSSKPLRFIRTVFSPKEFDFEGTIKRNKESLCAIWGHNPLLLASNEFASYNNLQTIQSSIYENKILPDVYKIIDFLQQNFTKNVFLKVDTSKITALSKDEKAQAETINIESTFIINLNKSVRYNEMTKENAVAFLISNGYDKEIANNLINENTKENIQTQNV